MSRKKNKRKKAKQVSSGQDVEQQVDELVGTKTKCWESGLEISTDDKCPHIVNRETPKIIVPYEIWHQIMALTKEIDTEWLGYLGGSLLQDGNWKVVDIKVPKQEVTGGSVKPTDTLQAEGVVHSHVDMGCFFSSCDDAYLNENHGFGIVVNKKEANKAVIRVDLPCGAMSIIEADVVIEYPGCPDITEFLEEAKKNIEEEKTVVTTYPNNYRVREWNQEKCCWEEPPSVDDHLLNNASDEDVGVPDYNPKYNRQKYKGWDYYNEQYY